MATFPKDHEHEEIHVRTAGPGDLRGHIIDAGGAVRDLDAGNLAGTDLDGPEIGPFALHATVDLRWTPAWGRKKCSIACFVGANLGVASRRLPLFAPVVFAVNGQLSFVSRDGLGACTATTGQTCHARRWGSLSGSR